ncbi:MAG TPA: hypothetical protein VEL76_16565 [Gemmataceae bacterium]|nr:hypothetical protein [Gemmataceae bacterium]
MVPLRFLSPLFLACALLSAGCGQQRELKEIYPVRGKVLFEGKSPQGARVVFHPAGNPDPRAILPHAEVGADGTFVMSTYNFEDGAPAGTYAVTVTHFQGGGPTNLLPARYDNPSTSGLQAIVQEQSTELPPVHLTRNGTTPKTP